MPLLPSEPRESDAEVQKRNSKRKSKCRFTQIETFVYLIFFAGKLALLE